MLNYLQRVATAGASLRPSALPLVSVPVLPATVRPSPAEAIERGELGKESTPVPAASADSFVATPTPESVVRPAETSAIDVAGLSRPETKPIQPPEAPPSRPAQDPVPLSAALARMKSGPRVRAPKALRLQMPQPFSPGLPTADRAQVSETGSSRDQSSLQSAEEPRIQKETQRSAESLDIPQMHASPPDLRPHMVSALEDHEPRDSHLSPNVPAVSPRQHSPRRLVPHDEAPKPESILIEPIGAASVAPTVALQERGHQRQSVVSIGRIDVQVINNRAQPAKSAGNLPAPRTQRGFSESSFLSRFTLRP